MTTQAFPPGRPVILKYPQQETGTIRRKGIVGARLAAAAMIGWGLAYLSILPGASSASLPTPVSSTNKPMTISNAAHKGDRLVPLHAGRAQNDANHKDLQGGGAGSGVRKIPVGCESAFSKLLVSGNFSARCVT